MTPNSDSVLRSGILACAVFFPFLRYEIDWGSLPSFAPGLLLAPFVALWAVAYAIDRAWFYGQRRHVPRLALLLAGVWLAFWLAFHAG